MDKIIFATHNENKVKEVASVLDGRFELLSLTGLGFEDTISEPYDTIEDNAKEKARVIYEWAHQDCFAEDTGLFVNALDGEPGVHSARYAGDHDAAANMNMLLANLSGKQDRSACFQTAICLILNGKSHIFVGRCDGVITDEKKGNKGFGYDPVFVPDGSDKTFAEMGLEEKNKFSHRRKAIDKLTSFLLKN